MLVVPTGGHAVVSSSSCLELQQTLPNMHLPDNGFYKHGMLPCMALQVHLHDRDTHSLND